MKRDMDLVRQILLAVEASPNGYAEDLHIDSVSQAVIGYHCYLICDAGLAVGADMTCDGSGPEWQIAHLTWAGHEFIEASRNDETWNKAKKIVKDSGGGLVLESLKAALNTIVQAGVAAAVSPYLGPR